MADLLTLTSVTGELSLDDHGATITCTITVAQDGTAIVNCNPITITPDNRWLFDRAIQHDPGFLPWWHLRATTTDGDTITSDHLTISNHQLSPGEAGTTVTLEAHAGRMTITHDSATTAHGCSVTYHTIGMRGHSAQHATTPEGNITLAGAPQPENEEHITGFLKITAHADEQRPLNDWLAAREERARHTLRIISLADGKNLHWSIRQTRNEDALIATELYGPQHTGSGQDHVFHFLNLQPVLDIAVNNYTPELRATTGIETAIGLFLINTRHVEVQLLVAMTALEHFTSIYTTHHHVPTPLPKEMFTIVKKALQRTYDLAMNAFPTTDREKSKRVRNKIGQLNQTTFHDELAAMVQDYGVPVDDIKERIAQAREARNDIAHKGTTKADFRTFYGHVLVLRELIKRIILTLLKYEGQYQSFLNGPSWTTFPPIDTTVVQ